MTQNNSPGSPQRPPRPTAVGSSATERKTEYLRRRNAIANADAAPLVSQMDLRRSSSVRPSAAGTAAKPRMDAREAMLRRTIARLPCNDMDPVREVVIQLLLTTPARGSGYDSSDARYVARFASWVHRTQGSFNPDVDCTDQLISEWTRHEFPNRTEPSRNYAWSTIRRIRGHRDQVAARHSTSRPHGRRPHSDLEWARFESTADSIENTATGRQVRMMLDLAGEAGLRTVEMNQTRGTWVQATKYGAVLTVPNSDGVVRYVPVLGAAGQRLAQHVGNHELLLIPEVTDRRNAVTRILMQAKRRTGAGMNGFTVNAARHRWLLGLLQRSLPFTTIATIADINPGSHLVTDLIHYLATPDPKDVADRFARQLQRWEPK